MWCCVFPSWEGVSLAVHGDDFTVCGPGKALQWITKLITFGKAHGKPQHREELLAVAKLAQKSGDLDTDESRILHNMLDLGSVSVADVTTPRTVMYSMPLDMPLERFAHEVEKRPFSRIPLYNGDSDDIRGFVLKSDALMACITKPDSTLESVLRPIDSVPNIMRVDILLKQILIVGT